MRKNIVMVLVLYIAFFTSVPGISYAAPSNGTRLPPKFKIESGYEYNAMFKCALIDSYGDISTQDHFYTLSYGVADWLSIDGKIGFGDITEKNGKLPDLSYTAGFAGGYGFRMRVLDDKKRGLRGIIGFQHISVHPSSRNIDNDKYEAILDDWQGSAILAKDFKSLTVYAGMKGSQCQLIYTLNEHDRKWVSPDWHLGLITGAELYLFDKKARLNAEGRFFDETALTASLSYLF